MKDAGPLLRMAEPCSLRNSHNAMTLGGDWQDHVSDRKSRRENNAHDTSYASPFDARQ